jgi:hypothetical protein
MAQRDGWRLRGNRWEPPRPWQRRRVEWAGERGNSEWQGKLGEGRRRSLSAASTAVVSRVVASIIPSMMFQKKIPRMSIVKDEADHSTMLTLDSSLKLIGLNIAGESNACSRSSMGASRFCQLFFFGIARFCLLCTTTWHVLRFSMCGICKSLCISVDDSALHSQHYS